MSSHAIVTLSVGPVYETLSEISHPLIESYARRIGADFIVERDFRGHEIGPYAKLEIIHELLERYDRVLFLDSDILVRADAPDIFSVVGDDRLGLFNEGSVLDRSIAWQHVFHCLGYPVNPMENMHGKLYFNTGVIVASRCHQSLFTPFADEVDCYSEQSAFNVRLWSRKVNVQNLPYRFNRINALSGLTGESWDDSYFAHYAGCFGTSNPSFRSNVEQFKAMARRFERYTLGNVPRFQQAIRIDYQGALGDIVAGEPLIRYLVEQLYPDEDVTVRCTQPQVLAHLDCTVKGFDEYHCENPSEYVITPIPKDVQDPIFHITHPLDFMSIKAFKGMLPKKYRGIKLQPAESIPWDVSFHVLIHFGKTWTSKTFPVDFCNEVIQGLIGYGIPVALIGNHTVDGLDSKDCLDIRGLTDLPQLFKLIADAPLLISNDSSPVHIAGAFGNPCIMIPSCKHPDHIWPQRADGLNVTVGKHFPLNVRPNTPREVHRVDEATETEMRTILPEAVAVVNEAIWLWQKFRAGLPGAVGKLYNSSQEDMSI